jgi:predicted GNAT family acetyltransferase
MTDDIDITHNAEESRYELRIGGEVASIAEYTPRGETLVFDHTVTEPGFRGRGLAAKLVRAALDDVREQKRNVVASCWFVAEFIDDHPEYQDLIA